MGLSLGMGTIAAAGAVCGVVVNLSDGWVALRWDGVGGILWVCVHVFWVVCVGY